MKYPRRDPAFTCTRRQLWPALLQELFVVFGSVKGGLGARLSELGSLPDERLAQVKPMINPEYQIFVDQGHIWARSRRTQAALKLFPMDEENLAVFNRFDGRHSLGEVSQQLVQEMGWDEAQSFAYARELFLSLVGRWVCFPKDPPELGQ